MKFDKISNRYFGIELESHPVVSGSEILSVIKKNSNHQVVKTKWKQTINNDFWHIKTDSTCSGGNFNLKGWEIASFKAKGYEDLLEICNVAKCLKKIGLRCGEDCGFHVHVDISDFSVEQASVLLANWIKIEKIILKTVPNYRSKNKFCRCINSKVFNKNKKIDPKTFWDLYGPKNTSIHNNKDKKVTMNLVNYLSYIQFPYAHDKRPTVEFRFPEGTFDEKDIKNWVLFFINFVENNKNKSMPDNLLCVKNIKDFLEICGIFSEKNKRWLFKRISVHDTKKKWKKISENILYTGNCY